MRDCSVRGRDGREGRGTRTEGRPDASLRAKSGMRRKQIASCDPLKRIARHKAGRCDVFHVEQDRQRRSGITTWRDFSLLASRTNVLFSGAMLMFMGSSMHMSHGPLGSASQVALWVIVAIIAALELNAIKGKLWPAMATVKGVIHCSIALAVVLWLIMSLL